MDHSRKTLFAYFFFVVVVVTTVTTVHASVTDVCTGIPPVSVGYEYHSDEVCDRGLYNQFKGSLNRHLIYKSLMKTGGNHLVPDQKTVYCPLAPQELWHSSHSPGTATPTTTAGLDTVWIVENTSSFPVVITYVNEYGQEVSAVNPKIQPPTADAASVLHAGDWMAVNTFEGHVFHARRILPDGGMGQILLQHRVGLIPVGSGAVDLICPDEDIEPIEEETMEVPEEFQRTPPEINRQCNTIDIGFRNKANCPLNGYYVKHSDSSPCEEMFKFHLGLESHPSDFMWDWTSQTKFEGSFIGHTFAFRLAADESVLVDTVTLKPTRVIDCPTLKVAASASHRHSAAASIEIDVMARNGWQQNTTDSKQQQYYEYYHNETTSSHSYQVHATARVHSY